MSITTKSPTEAALCTLIERVEKASAIATSPSDAATTRPATWKGGRGNASDGESTLSRVSPREGFAKGARLRYPAHTMWKAGITLALVLATGFAGAQETKLAALKADTKAKPTDANAAFALGR